MKRLFILMFAIALIAAPAMAEQRTSGSGVPNIHHGPTSVPAGNLGGNLPQQNVPQNSLTNSAAAEQAKLAEIQRKAKWRKECKKMAYQGANALVPYCQNGYCSPQMKPKWQEKFDMINKQCLKQHKAE